MGWFVGHRVRLGFGARLLLSMLMALALVGVASYALQSRQIQHRIIDEHVREQRADAATFVAIGRRTDAGLDALFDEIDEVLRSVRTRPGVLETVLMDDTGLIRVSGGDHSAVGHLNADRHV